MKFSTRTDIAAPVEFVFAQLSDFPGFEAAARRRGAEVTRLDTLAAPGRGCLGMWRFGCAASAAR